MQRLQIHSLLLLIGLTVTLSACFTEPNYSDTPEITSAQVFPYKDLPAGQGVGRGRRDSIVVTIGFRDGDGNLGNDIPVSKEDSVRFANTGWGNYRIRTFRLEEGRYREIILPVNQTLFLPNLTRNKPKPGAIEGTLDYNSTFQYGNRFQLYPVKFQIQIRDRAFNESNVFETDTVYVPFPRQL